MNAAVTLAEQQRTFIDLLLDDGRPLPIGWDGDRLAIYRNAYRARIVDAINDTYPRTRRWVGEDAFRQAAIHHVITNPPASWTLDAVGEAFPSTLAELFAADREVAELAWLEWAMHVCFVSADEQSIDAAGFARATAGFHDSDWASMRLQFVPGTQLRRVAHRIDELWKALGEQGRDMLNPASHGSVDGRRGCLVWRQAFTPVFRIVDEAERLLLAELLTGANYGEACELLAASIGGEAAVAEAGVVLARWLRDGLLTAISVA